MPVYIPKRIKEGESKRDGMKGEKEKEMGKKEEMGEGKIRKGNRKWED